MSQSAQSAALALYEANRAQFFKNTDYELDVQNTSDGPVCYVEGEEVPLLDMAFNLKIVQPGHVPTNKELKDLVGKILIVFDKDQEAEEYTDEMFLLPITHLGSSRSYYKESYDAKNGDSRPDCASRDGLYPNRDVVMPMHGQCAELTLGNNDPFLTPVCPKAVWTDGKRPECREQIALAFFDLERHTPVRMYLHGKAISAWTSLRQQYKQARNIARLKKKSINDYVIKLTVNNEGTYVIPQFKLIEAPEKIGKPANWVAVCKYYLQSLFANPPKADGETAVSAKDMANAPELAEKTIDVTAAETSEEFTV